ncbi:MAG: hypothetical protein JO052_21085 [Bradyrhizobium sp.]|nr:hypothetical protein [Bradyrhizobium sp.]
MKQPSARIPKRLLLAVGKRLQSFAFNIGRNSLRQSAFPRFAPHPTANLAGRQKKRSLRALAQPARASANYLIFRRFFQRTQMARSLLLRTHKFDG